MEAIYVSRIDIFLMVPDETIGRLFGMEPKTGYQFENEVRLYIQKNRLWDSNHPEVIRSDSALKPLFDGKDEIAGVDLDEYIYAHLTATDRSVNNTPKTYLLTWNPKKWNWTDLKDCVAATKESSILNEPWSCGRSKRIRTGDRVFLNRQGVEPKGIMASGTATSDVYEEGHWDSGKAV